MKRCPDCGFRSKEPLKTCPLCGVRMRESSNGNPVPYATHTHREKGEKCLLPNPGQEKPVRLPERKNRMSATRTNRQKSTASQIAGVVFALILFILTEACSS